jgi:RNA polymerase sigma-70 factor (ECF subfamily)
VASRKPSVFGLPAGLPPEAMIAGIRAWLVPVVGDDADLVLGATVYGETQRELADRLRIPHEAARKRFQRAMNRIRRRLRDDL